MLREISLLHHDIFDVESISSQSVASHFNEHRLSCARSFSAKINVSESSKAEKLK